MTQILIIGGSDAGISAALAAKARDHSAQVTVVVADRFPNYSLCGLPFYLSGEVSDWRTLAHRRKEDIERQGIQLLLEQRATTIDPDTKAVSVTCKSGLSHWLRCDKLIIATGAVSARPPIPGLDLPGVFTLRWMEDAFFCHHFMEEHCPESAIIIGSGYIAMEMADALTRRGLSVAMLIRSGRVLKTLDAEMGEIIRTELSRHGVRLIEHGDVSAIEKRGPRLVVKNAGENPVDADIILVATGVRPETTLARNVGVLTGAGGAIKVIRTMETNVENIYAAGDCAETFHGLLKKCTYLPLGTTAHKQGRVAGENAAGGQEEFAGSSGTQVVKIFDLVAARTGLTEDEARHSGFAPLTVQLETWDHKAYYPGATPMYIRITGDRTTHRLLGAQIVGHYKSEISKRIDIFATALFNEMKIESLNHLDLSYTPPLATPWDSIQMCAQEWVARAMRTGARKPKA